MLVIVLTILLMAALPFGVEEIRRDKFVLYVMLGIIALRQVWVLIATLYPEYGMELSDAAAFHRNAVQVAETNDYYFGIGTYFYVNLLGVVYKVLGNSQIFAKQLTLLVFVVSMILFFKMDRIINNGRYSVPNLIVFGLSPAMIVMTSSTLREAWQLLFFLCAMYYGVRYISEQRGVYLAQTALFGFLMSLFHKALVLIAMVKLCCVYFWSSKEQGLSEWGRKGQLTVAGVIGLVVIVGLVAISERLGDKGGEVLRALFNGHLLDYIAQYHSILQDKDGRAGFSVTLDTSSWIGLLTSWFWYYLHYMFEPFPWQVGGIKDVYGMLESLFRLCLIGCLAYMMVMNKDRRKAGIYVLVIMYFLMTVFWSLGTANYGQAIRHHVLSNWILLVVAGPLFWAIAEKRACAFFPVAFGQQRRLWRGNWKRNRSLPLDSDSGGSRKGE